MVEEPEAEPPPAADLIGKEIITKREKFEKAKKTYADSDSDKKTTEANIAVYTSGFELYSYIMANDSKQSDEVKGAAKKNYTELLNKLADECITQAKKAEAKSDPKAYDETKKLCEYFMKILDNAAKEIKEAFSKSKTEEIQSFINNVDSKKEAVSPKELLLPKGSSDVSEAELAKAMKTIDALYSFPEVKEDLARAVARASTRVQAKKEGEAAAGAGAGAEGGTQRVGTKKRKRRKRRGKGTGKNKPLSEVNVVL